MLGYNKGKSVQLISFLSLNVLFFFFSFFNIVRGAFFIHGAINKFFFCMCEIMIHLIEWVDSFFLQRVMSKTHWNWCPLIYQKMAVEGVLTRREEACLHWVTIVSYNFIISSVMDAFWLVLTYDLLEDRRIDDVIIKTFFLYILILYFIKQIDTCNRVLLMDCLKKQKPASGKQRSGEN